MNGCMRSAACRISRPLREKSQIAFRGWFDEWFFTKCCQITLREYTRNRVLTRKDNKMANARRLRHRLILTATYLLVTATGIASAKPAVPAQPPRPAVTPKPTGGGLDIKTPNGSLGIHWTDPWDHPNWRPPYYRPYRPPLPYQSGYGRGPYFLPPQPHWEWHPYYGWNLVY